MDMLNIAINNDKSTVLDYINWAVRYLEEHNIENPRYDAEEIFSFVFKKNRIQIYLDKDNLIPEEWGKKFISLIKKRAKRYPLQYIIKNVNFYGLNFVILPGVFIPRPETEILVEKTIEIVKELNKQTVNLLDIGTGSGCIAISLAKALSNSSIIATDISKKAIELARLNACLHKVEERIRFIKTNMFLGLREHYFDIIVSNPPYIPYFEMEKLQPEVKFEPISALDGGEEGIFYIKRIIKESPKYLNNKGKLVIEIGYKEKEKVEEIFSHSSFREIKFIQDYRGIDRIAIFEK